MGFLSIFLLASLLAIIVFNIIVLEGKYNDQLQKLNKSSELLIANKDQKNSQNISGFHFSEHASVVWNMVNREDGMNVYADYLNQHIAAINSLNMSKKLLQQEEAIKKMPAVALVAKVISEELVELRSHALRDPKLLKYYKDKDIKRAISLLQNISMSGISRSERRKILHRAYHRLVEQAQTMTVKMISVLNNGKKVALFFLSGVSILCLLLLFVQIKIIRGLIRGSSDVTKKILFIRDYLRENNGSDHSSYSNDKPLEYLFNEAKTLVGVLSNKILDMKKLNEKIKNSNSLASLLGYEINAMTSIVAGGLSLTQKEEEPDAVFKHEIYGALTSLENLSDNFNHLFSEKHQKTNLAQEFNVHAQLNKMFVHLDDKCRSLKKEFDFVIEDSVSKFASGDAYRFYWCFYNIFMRYIDAMEQGYCLAHVSEIEGTSIANRRLQIIFLSTSGEYSMLSSLLTSMDHIDDNQVDSMNMQLYKRIVNSFFTGSVSLKETDLGNSRIAVNVMITPVEDKEQEQEQEQEQLAKVLIYAKDGLQTSILLKKIAAAGVDAIQCTNADNLLKKLFTDATFSFVFISEDLFEDEKIVNVIKRQTSAKVVLLSSLNDKTKMIDNKIDKILKLPLYQSKLIALLSGKEEILSDKEEGKKVLIVDDDPAQQFILSHFLKRVGIVATLANESDSALRLIKDNAFDLVFMDCIMPGTDGFEATALIREYEEILKRAGEFKKEITIIGNTSLTSEREIEKCIQSGMNAVLNKPYRNENILNLLAQLA